MSPRIAIGLLINGETPLQELYLSRDLIAGLFQARRWLASRPHGLYGPALSRPAGRIPSVTEMAKIKVAKPVVELDGDERQDRA